MSKPRIGVLTSGGDCPGLNAVLRGVVLAADKLGWEVLGFLDGFEGLLPPGNYRVLKRRDTSGIMPRHNHRHDESWPFHCESRCGRSDGGRGEGDR
jgi:hypothetical protein